MANRLAFVRWCGAYPGGWSAERVVFTGEGEPQSFIADEEDRVLVDEATVETLGSIQALRAHFAKAVFVAPPLIVEP